MKKLVFYLQLVSDGAIYNAKGESFQKALDALIKKPKKGQQLRFDLFEDIEMSDVNPNSIEEMFDLLKSDKHIHSETITF